MREVATGIHWNFRAQKAETLNLQQAIRQEDWEIVDELIRQRKDLNNVDLDGYTALYLAVISNNLGLARKLLEVGADPNYQLFFGRTVLHTATLRHNTAMSELLLEFNADATIQADDGFSVAQLIEPRY